jgi:hypothetical protein
VIRGIAVAILLAGCAQQVRAPRATVRVFDLPPVYLSSCPGSVPVPPTPPVPRSVEQVGAWAIRLDTALHETERARAICAARLRRLNEWIDGGVLDAK